MSINNNCDNYSSLDSEDIYFKDLEKYSLLSEEEVISCGKDLKLINGSKIIKKVANTTTLLDLKKIFKALENIENYDDVLKYLKVLYKHNHNLKTIEQYESAAALLERPLTNREYFIYFNEELPEEDIVLTYDELIEQINNYVLYSRAKEKLFNSNLKLVKSFAKKYLYGNLPLLEIIAEGNLGLLKAIDRFDVDLNYKFSTYAAWWIRQAIMTYVSSNIGTFTLSRHVYDDLNEFNKKLAQLKEQSPKNYSAREIADIFNMDYSIVVAYLTYTEKCASLDQPVTEEEDTSLGDLIKDDNTSVEDVVMKNSLSEEVEILLSKLQPNEIYVIKMRFGLIDKEHTLEEIANTLDITRERVRQIESRALAKLRRYTAKQDESIKVYLK